MFSSTFSNISAISWPRELRLTCKIYILEKHKRNTAVSTVTYNLRCTHMISTHLWGEVNISFICKIDILFVKLYRDSNVWHIANYDWSNYNIHNNICFQHMVKARDIMNFIFCLWPKQMVRISCFHDSLSWLINAKPTLNIPIGHTLTRNLSNFVVTLQY